MSSLYIYINIYLYIYICLNYMSVRAFCLNNMSAVALFSQNNL